MPAPAAENVYLSKTDMVTAAIRELIMNGELRPGDALRQRNLADRFNVSPTPVREALRRLETEGFVSENTHRGSSVVEVDFGATQENYRIRAALESLAVELAAERMTEERLEEIEAIHRELASHRGEDKEVHELNRLLHFRIYEAADSPLLLSLLRRLWQAFPHGPQVVRPFPESIRQHGEIIEALRDRDPQGAAARTRAHIMDAAARLATQPEAHPDT